MLLELNVKNIALIEEEEIEFSKGLNILTGETGAGKSIILGALSLALGAKAEKSMLRDTDKDAYAEAVFSVEDTALCERLDAIGVEVSDGEVILSRRLSGARSVAKINGEGVPAKKLKEAGELLIDIYGQSQHVSLLKKGAHLAMLDSYAAGRNPILSEKKQALSEAYKEYRAIKQELESSVRDDEEREKELLFLRHEAEEIEAAKLFVGEDEALEEEYDKLSNSQKIMEACGAARQALSDEGASEATGRALREISQVSGYDKKLSDVEAMLSDADGLISDALRELSSYAEDAEYDGERMAFVEERLNTINRLKDKYGSSIEKVLSALNEKSKKIEKLCDYENYLSGLKSSLSEASDKLFACCEEVSSIRQNAAKELCERVRKELLELNFLDVEFSMRFEKMEPGANGFDDAEFMICLNPGSPLLPLREVASGGELSRIMLSLKTVLASGDAIDTLIFDEIDAGISGRTAQAVAEKLTRVGEAHQVICITHLPQIAACADRHFRIEKRVQGDSTISSIFPLDKEGSVEELARMLGGAEITEAVRQNARELLGVKKG